MAETAAIRLHADPRSSSCMRVLCAFAFKGIAVEQVLVDLGRDQHRTAAFGAIHPAGLVPVLELGDGTVLGQSLAILQWLEEAFPAPAALPAHPLQRARVLEICGIVASDLHPVASLRVRKRLAQRFGLADAEGFAWSQAWMQGELPALENVLRTSAGRHAVVDALTWADFMLAPALLNAERHGCSLEAWPTALRVYRNALSHPAMQSVRSQRIALRAAPDG